MKGEYVNSHTVFSALRIHHLILLEMGRGVIKEKNPP